MFELIKEWYIWNIKCRRNAALYFRFLESEHAKTKKED